MNLDDIDVSISVKQVPLDEVRPGFCIDEDGNAIFKTEYADSDSSGNYRPICYNRAGERWSGDFSTLVRSITIE